LAPRLLVGSPDGAQAIFHYAVGAVLAGVGWVGGVCTVINAFVHSAFEAVTVVFTSGAQAARFSIHVKLGARRAGALGEFSNSNTLPELAAAHVWIFPSNVLLVLASPFRAGILSLVCHCFHAGRNCNAVGEELPGRTGADLLVTLYIAGVEKLTILLVG